MNISKIILPSLTVIILTLSVLLWHNSIVKGDVSCVDGACGWCSCVTALAEISGDSPSTSSGSGSVHGSLPYGSWCCYFSSTMKVVIGSEYKFYAYYGPIDEDYFASFYPAGRYVYASVDDNYCDGTRASVIAYLTGYCGV